MFTPFSINKPHLNFPHYLRTTFLFFTYIFFFLSYIVFLLELQTYMGLSCKMLDMFYCGLLFLTQNPWISFYQGCADWMLESLDFISQSSEFTFHNLCSFLLCCPFCVPHCMTKHTNTHMKSPQSNCSVTTVSRDVCQQTCNRRQMLLFTLKMNETDRCSTCLNSSLNA